MSNLEAAQSLIMRIQGLVHDEDIQIDDSEELITKNVVGGSITKKSGRRLLTVKIPYSVSKEYVVQKLNEIIQYRKKLEQEVLEIDEYITELEGLLVDHRE